MEGMELLGLMERLGIALAVVAGQALLVRLIWFIFKKISARVKAGAGHKIKPFTIRNLRILTTKQFEEVIFFFLKAAKYFITAVLFFITVPIIFTLFPATEQIAANIFAHILDPLKNLARGAVGHVPNIITIIIILIITKYVIKGLKFFAAQIASERLKLPGFYPDWAWPTFNILRVLLYAFTVAVVYPYLPGSDSRVFQGVSVFVGIIFSLGSSSAIGNLVAGLVITYMRPFKTGDRIQIKDFTGFVVEKSPFVTRLRNIRNEYITFPNLTVLGSEIINYNTSSEDGEAGLILHASITVRYDVPWRDVYDVLIRAAAKTHHIEAAPKPFALQTSLDSSCASYEINVYTKEVEKIRLIYSLLYQNIQDEFRHAGISMVCPQYEADVTKDISAGRGS